MKNWPLYVITTVLCWGTYVPLIHGGQLGFGAKNGALRAFLFVGVAYFIMATTVLGWLVLSRAEPLEFARRGVTLSTAAGVLGAVGALGVILAMMHGGKPIVVAPLVFAGAPIVNTIVSMIWHRPESSPHPMFYAGIALAALGAAMVLRFKPA